MTAQTIRAGSGEGSPEQERHTDLLRSYRAELPADVLDLQGELLDRVIGYAFDTLNASQLTLQVTVDALPSHLQRVML
jgi:hypothetical protein